MRLRGRCGQFNKRLTLRLSAMTAETPGVPKTLLDACCYYADPKVCFETMLGVKWPDGKIVCPKCGGSKIGVIRTRQMLQCSSLVTVKGVEKKCGKQFSVKVGTIFEDSPLGLDKWLVAAWCIANAKNGISSCKLGRALGVTQKTAWFMLMRIREAMKTPAARKAARKLNGRLWPICRCHVGSGRQATHLANAHRAKRRGFHGDQVMAKPPEGAKETEQLLRVLVRVPKTELDEQLAKRKAKKKAAKRKK